VARSALHSSLSSQWFTPPRWLSPARDFLGGEIGLDPASNALANTLVQAQRFFDGSAPHLDGLKQPWVTPKEAPGLYANWPYSVKDGGPVGRWVEKAHREVQAGSFPAGVALVNATPGTDWFSSFWRTCDVCFLDERIAYWEPTLQAILRFARERCRDLLVERDGRSELDELLAKHPADAILRSLTRTSVTEVAPGLVEGPAPTHTNAFVRLAGDPRRFLRAFGRFGIVIPAGSGRRLGKTSSRIL